MSESTRAVRFRAFHEKNPQVYDRLRQMALALKAAGHRRWGMRNLWEKLRYDLAVQTTATNFRLNDHFPPFYARLLMKQCPELKGFFEIRGEGKVAA
jgi:hypothetical protein